MYEIASHFLPNKAFMIVLPSFRSIPALDIGYTICSINFMFSKSSRLSTSSSKIAEYFGASSSTISQKSRLIKDLLKIRNVFDPNFSLEEVAENNPFNHLVMRNGIILFDW